MNENEQTPEVQSPLRRDIVIASIASLVSLMIFFLRRQTGGVEAPRLVGGIAGLCIHPNIGGLCHSLPQLLAQGNYRSGTNVFFARDFLHNSGW
jgi:hypothetical protein